MAQLRQFSATGEVKAGGSYLKGVVLTAGADNASVEISQDGSPVLTLKALADTSETWVTGARLGSFGNDLEISDLTGTGPLVSVEFE